MFSIELLVDNEYEEKNEEVVKVPLLGKISCGNPIEAIERPNEFFDIAQRQYQENDYASAIEYCNHAIDFYHNSPQIAKLKAMSYEKELNYRGAVKYYQQYLAMNPDASDRAAIESKIQQFAPKSN